jgi:hypothetical protein
MLTAFSWISVLFSERHQAGSPDYSGGALGSARVPCRDGRPVTWASRAAHLGKEARGRLSPRWSSRARPGSAWPRPGRRLGDRSRAARPSTTGVAREPVATARTPLPQPAMLAEFAIVAAGNSRRLPGRRRVPSENRRVTEDRSEPDGRKLAEPGVSYLVTVPSSPGPEPGAAEDDAVGARVTGVCGLLGSPSCFSFQACGRPA